MPTVLGTQGRCDTMGRRRCARNARCGSEDRSVAECSSMLRRQRLGIAASGRLWRENTLSAMQNVTLGGQVASGSLFDTVLFLFIQSIQGRLALKEKANKKHDG